ncbi:MAG: HAD-IC family P-type ATPase [bacterium]|nr:HAD-IC family P-type ATPase [bacterium]
MSEIYWHHLSSEEAVKILGADLEKGLREKQVNSKRAEFGKNKLPEEKPLSRLKVLLQQFRSPLIYILIVAGIITLVLKEFADSIVIFGAVLLNTVVGYFQENKASKALSELKKVVKHQAEVIREGDKKIVDSEELVPGDIIILNPGDKVPADGRIIEAHNLKVNEMALTGEWLPATKISEILPEDTSMADRDNMVYMGTIIEDGKGKAVVTETGTRTEIGEVASLVKETKEEKTPLQKKIGNFSRIIGIAIAVIAAFVFIEGIITGNTFIEMFTTSVAIAVAAIPEGLPVAMTVILALGMQRILKRKGLVKNLLAAETLGGTSVIATDKTCTLTEGKMKIAEVFTLDNRRATKEMLFKVSVLSNDAFIENPREEPGHWIVRGEPTEKALLMGALQEGFRRTDFEKKEVEINEIVFDPKRKYHATLYKTGRRTFNVYVLGAPEKLLQASKMRPESLAKIEKRLEKLTGQGHRVVAAAWKKLPDPKISAFSNFESEIKDLTFLGLVAMHDPLRGDVKEAMKLCIQAGMKPVIVTGDHKLTAKAIAEELGFKLKSENIIEGSDLDMLSDRELQKNLEKIKVYARVEPKHKIRIIEAWQRKGQVVAMTGDGINDAPALKKADIGVALGSGTEVAKETSDLILLNDSFSVIVAAIEEGRAVLDNIRKVITYLLSSSFSEIILIAGALVAGFPLPILPTQILWINLITDGLPDIALAFESKEKDLMSQKPQGNKVPLLTQEMKIIIFVIGILTDIILLGLFFWLWRQGYSIEYVRTMIFSGLAISSLFYVFSCKSLRRNIWHINPFSNKFLVLAVLIGFLMLFTAIYFSPFQSLLKTVPLQMSDWLILVGLGLVNIIAIEVTKWYFIIKKKTS